MASDGNFPLVLLTGKEHIMCLGGGGSQKVVEVYSDGVVAVEDFSGKRHTASTDIVAAKGGVKIGDYVRVVQGYITEKVDPVKAEQARQLLAELASKESFVLVSAQGDDAYQPEAPPFFPMNFGQRPLPI